MLHHIKGYRTACVNMVGLKRLRTTKTFLCIKERFVLYKCRLEVKGGAAFRISTGRSGYARLAHCYGR